MTTKGNTQRIVAWQYKNKQRVREHRARFAQRHPDYWKERRAKPEYQEAQRARVKAWRDRKRNASQESIFS